MSGCVGRREGEILLYLGAMSVKAHIEIIHAHISNYATGNLHEPLQTCQSWINASSSLRVDQD